MARWLSLAVAVVLAGTATDALAQPRAPSELVPLYPKQAEVVAPAGSGLVELRLPPEVLEHTRGDLGDLRLFDAGGNELPFLVESAAPTRSDPLLVARPARTLEVRRERVPRAGLRPLFRERLVVQAPRERAESGAWQLVFSSPRSQLVREVEVWSSGNAPEKLAQSTIFRMRDPEQERLSIALPAELPARLELVLTGEEHYLEPTLGFRSITPGPKLPRLEIALVEIARESSGGRTRIELARPSGVVPDRVRVETDTQTFDRPLEVYDAGPGGGNRQLGAGSVTRVGNSNERLQLEVAIGASKSDRLLVSIVDDDSPPLERLRVHAVVEQPSLLFELRGSGVLRFGGARTRPARYDLARLAGSEPIRRLVERGEVRQALLGDVSNNPEYRAAPALEAVQNPGAPVDLRRFSQRARVLVDSAPEGVSRFRLSPEVLARARPDLGDLRLVDEQGKNRPFLLETAGVVEELTLTIGATEHDTEGSRISLRPSVTPLPAAGITLATDARYVDRAFKLVGRVDGQAVMLTEGRLLRADGEQSPLTIDFSPTRLESLELSVEDGDDAPLRFTRAGLRIPSADLFVVAPPGNYWLLVGDAAAEPPRFELARARDVVLALPSATARALPPEANPRHVPRPSGAASEVALWTTLVFAVLVLGALTLRLARREVGPEPDAPAPGA
jgi:hypothetical protein